MSLNWSRRNSELLRKTSCLLGGPNLIFFSFLHPPDLSMFCADDWWKQCCLGWNGGPQARSWHLNEELQGSWVVLCLACGLKTNAAMSSPILIFAQIGPGNTRRPSCMNHRFCFQGYWDLSCICFCSDDTKASVIGLTCWPLHRRAQIKV